jgi:phage baseplate assembly protein W
MAVPQGFQVPFEISKTKGSPVVAEGVALLESSIRMILRTVPGERPYRANFGSWLPLMIFSNMTEGTAMQAIAEAKRALGDWEKRIYVEDILFELGDNVIALTVIWSPNGAPTQYRTTVGFRT